MRLSPSSYLVTRIGRPAWPVGDLVPLLLLVRSLWRSCLPINNVRFLQRPVCKWRHSGHDDIRAAGLPLTQWRRNTRTGKFEGTSASSKAIMPRHLEPEVTIRPAMELTAHGPDTWMYEICLEITFGEFPLATSRPSSHENSIDKALQP